MPRTARNLAGDLCYHVINRGNAGAAVFHEPADYASFIALMAEANERLAMRIAGFCVMPSHFHLLLWPNGDGELSRWMQWLMTSHVRRHHRRHVSAGHLWQGRFKAFPVQHDDHFLTVLHYVERNPVRAGLVDKAEDWRWSSLARDPAPDAPPRRTPVALPAGWAEFVNRAEAAEALEALRRSVNRGTPFGGPRWAARIAGRLGLEASMRPRGRPRSQALAAD